MARTDPQLKLRLSPELKEKVEKSADSNHRSINAEIVQRLDASLSGRPILDVSESEGLDADERALVRMWRAMNEGERFALRVVAERLAEKSSSDGTA
ncbi:Arc family DNA-binding protein [Acetobacter pasteurianus]|uniref:Arc-like DNA binding domain-containing protein n=1 Tax=Acetobacter pasteurianus subsp. pasteurianus TaxID=481145 RepID=A0AAC9X149_ACEPA|nr:hypothetical protein S101468_00901 [Acetobacter pasteurianus subsp. pasteurianus]